jgi:hypothetical protein
MFFIKLVIYGLYIDIHRIDLRQNLAQRLIHDESIGDEHDLQIWNFCRQIMDKFIPGKGFSIGERNAMWQIFILCKDGFDDLKGKVHGGLILLADGMILAEKAAQVAAIRPCGKDL